MAKNLKFPHALVVVSLCMGHLNQFLMCLKRSVYIKPQEECRSELLLKKKYHIICIILQHRIISDMALYCKVPSYIL